LSEDCLQKYYSALLQYGNVILLSIKWKLYILDTYKPVYEFAEVFGVGKAPIPNLRKKKGRGY